MDDCIETGFITQRGTNECFVTCVGPPPEEPEEPVVTGEKPQLDQINCSSSGDCPLGAMCNFDYGNSGFCEGNSCIICHILYVK